MPFLPTSIGHGSNTQTGGPFNTALVEPYIEEDSAAYYPNDADLAAIAASDRAVLSHWHYFKRSTANAPSPDYYDTGWLAPDGEGGIWLAHGGRMRDRPIYRAPLSGDWRKTDFIVDCLRAKRMHIDGFVYNETDVSTDQIGDMLDAAQISGLKIMLSIDCDTNDDKTESDVAAYINAYRRHPAVLRRPNGILMVGCYRPETFGVSKWTNILAAIGETAFFAPTFLDPAAYATFTGITDGASLWAGQDYRSYTGAIETIRTNCASDGKVFMSPVWGQDHRATASAYWETRGSRTAIAGWSYAISNTPDYVILNTWNDYAESHHWGPSWRTQFAFSDLARYYAEWFKTGVQPEIVRDCFLYFHRIEETDATETGQLQTADRFANRVTGDGETYDEIEMMAFLTEAATLEINGQQQAVSAGIQHFRIPWESGTPSFKIIRNNQTVRALSSNFTNRTVSDYQDLMYRGGSSTRNPVRNP